MIKWYTPTLKLCYNSNLEIWNRKWTIMSAHICYSALLCCSKNSWWKKLYNWVSLTNTWSIQHTFSRTADIRSYSSTKFRLVNIEMSMVLEPEWDNCRNWLNCETGFMCLTESRSISTIDVTWILEAQWTRPESRRANPHHAGLPFSFYWLGTSRISVVLHGKLVSGCRLHCRNRDQCRPVGHCCSGLNCIHFYFICSTLFFFPPNVHKLTRSIVQQWYVHTQPRVL